VAQEYYTVLTQAGLAYEAKSKAEKTPINLSYLAVGDGNGAPYNPGPEATQLLRETHRQPLNALSQDDRNPSWLMAEALLPEDVGGWTIREVGIYTDTGILYAIGKYPDSIKPLLPGGSTKQFYVKAIFQTSNAADVTLIVDNNVVAATRSFVIEHVKQELIKIWVQATELVRGVARIATQEQTDEGVDDSTIVTPKKLRMGFLLSRGLNGYIAFPTWMGGLIIQWVAGSASSKPISDLKVGEFNAWPLVYPNALFTAVATHEGSAAGTYLLWSHDPVIDSRVGIIVGCPEWASAVISARIISIGY